MPHGWWWGQKVGQGAWRWEEGGLQGLVLGRGPAGAILPFANLCSRETQAPLDPLDLLALWGSPVRRALEESWVSRAPVESG